MKPAHAYLSVVLMAVLLAFPGCRGGERTPERAAAGASAAPLRVAGVGFSTPESVLYDSLADVYLVSNIAGSPLERDDNGFISRLGPDGQVLALKWIDGASPAVTLHAPKGMALEGDTLFVADIDQVRLFHRASGQPLGSRPVPGATFLNDLSVGPDGTVYVTDSGLESGPQGFAPSGTDAVYRFDAAGRPVPVAKDTSLGRPNGVLAEAGGLTVVTFGSGQVFTLDPATGRRTGLPSPPAGSLDGVVRLADGSLAVSSWDGKAVYRLAPGGGTWTVAADSVEAPADIGYDTKRQRLLIPLFQANEVRIQAPR